MVPPNKHDTVRVSASEGAVFKTITSAIEANPKEIIVDDGEYTVDNLRHSTESQRLSVVARSTQAFVEDIT